MIHLGAQRMKNTKSPLAEHQLYTCKVCPVVTNESLGIKLCMYHHFTSN